MFLCETSFFIVSKLLTIYHPTKKFNEIFFRLRLNQCCTSTQSATWVCSTGMSTSIKEHTSLVWNLRYTKFIPRLYVPNTRFIPAIYQAKISLGPNTRTQLVWQFFKCAWYQYLPGIEKRKKNKTLISVLVWYVQKVIPVQHWF